MEAALDQKAQLVGFDKFNAVQDLLNCNKILISEINSNHEARTPESLARNLILIRELNKNVAEVRCPPRCSSCNASAQLTTRCFQVVKLYKELSFAVEEAIASGEQAKEQR